MRKPESFVRARRVVEIPTWTTRVRMRAQERCAEFAKYDPIDCQDHKERT